MDKLQEIAQMTIDLLHQKLENGGELTKDEATILEKVVKLVSTPSQKNQPGENEISTIDDDFSSLSIEELQDILKDAN